MWTPPHFYTTTEGEGKESMSEAIAEFRTGMHMGQGQVGQVHVPPQAPSSGYGIQNVPVQS